MYPGYQNSTNPCAYMAAFFTYDLQNWCSISKQNKTKQKLLTLVDRPHNQQHQEEYAA
jgi:hypothetical protein